MPAASSDIAAGTRPAVVVTWSDSAIQTRYPNARDALDSPAAGFFDDQADAQTVIDARGALIGTERRRFLAAAQTLFWPALTAVPTVSLTDADLAASGNFLASRLELDLETEATTFGLFG